MPSLILKLAVLCRRMLAMLAFRSAILSDDRVTVMIIVIIAIMRTYIPRLLQTIRNGTRAQHSMTKNKRSLIKTKKIAQSNLGTGRIATNASADPTHHPKLQLRRFTHFRTGMPQTHRWLEWGVPHFRPQNYPLPWTDP